MYKITLNKTEFTVDKFTMDYLNEPKVYLHVRKGNKEQSFEIEEDTQLKVEKGVTMKLHFYRKTIPPTDDYAFYNHGTGIVGYKQRKTNLQHVFTGTIEELEKYLRSEKRAYKQRYNAKTSFMWNKSTSF